MPYNLAFNPQFTVETHYIGQEHNPLLVVDDFLSHPDAMVSYAAQEAKFKPSPLYYPGIVAPAPQGYVQALAQGLIPRLGNLFGIRLPTANLLDSFFGIVTFAPEQLKIGQRLPHVDDFYSGQIAVLHYFCEGSQGGTAFYRHRTTGYETLNMQNGQHWQNVIDQEIAQSDPIPAQYLKTSNRLYEQIQAVEAKFNRMLVYRGNSFHSGMIQATTKIDPDPLVGRLTTNTFIRFELG